MSPVVKLNSTTTAVKGFTTAIEQKLRDVYCFLGIPYAEPPIDNLRFKPPTPKQLWKGVRDCTKFGSICPQNVDLLKKQYKPYKVTSNTSEDCLFLNVYTPTLDSNAKLPVMVWIHGGAFTMGLSNFFDGTALCNFNDVVCVTINYRLGLFGFLATGDGFVNGNMGLLDQVQALKWVQDHIEQFGGDSKNVTLFGESAGGISIALHLLSPLTKGLFHRAICQSGVSTYPGAIWSLQNARKYILNRLRKCGFTSTKGSEMIQFLNTLSPEHLMKTLGEGFQPVMDGTYLPDYPNYLYNKGLFHKEIDVIMGFNTHEGAMFVDEIARRLIKSPVDSISKANEILNFTVEVSFFRYCKNSEDIKCAIRNEYLKDAKDEDGYMKGLIEMYGDLLFVAPTFSCAKEHAEKASGNVYVYLYAHKLPFSRYQFDWIVTDHGEDILSVFGEPFLNRFPDVWRSIDKQFSRDIMQMWVKFAKTGNPVNDSTDWPQYRLDSEKMLVLKSNSHTASYHQPRRMQLWNKTIPNIVQMVKSKY